ADINGDGRPDIITATLWTFQVYLSLGTGFFTTTAATTTVYFNWCQNFPSPYPIAFPNNCAYYTRYMSAFSDVNGDGREDLVMHAWAGVTGTVNYGADHVIVYLANVDGTFGTVSGPNPPGGPNTIQPDGITTFPTRTAAPPLVGTFSAQYLTMADVN